MKNLYYIKHAVILTILSLQITTNCFSQGVAINTSGTSADASAILDITSDNAGILIPRMTETQKGLIPSPATGLMIYQTNGIKGFWYYDGTNWVQSIGATGATGQAGVAGVTGATGAVGATGFLAAGTIAGNTPYWDGTTWIVNSSNIFNNGGSVGIGTNNPDGSAKLDITSTNSGLLIPRMTTAERDLIVAPAQSLLISNITTNCIEVYFSPIWQSVFCGCSSPSTPTSGIHTQTETEITWNWNTVSGATGYKYNTNNDFASAIDNGTNTSFIQTALACNTSYDFYVWAYSICGSSSVATLTHTTSQCFTCGLNVNFTYKGIPAMYGSVNGDYNNGQYCWLDRNLGASQVASDFNDSNSFGDLFQWGRADDGHQNRNPLSNTTTTQSSSTNPGHSNFILGSLNWYSGPNPDDLWQAASGINNPCPIGWRLPTETELNNERANWLQNNYYGAISSALKLPATTHRNINGMISNASVDGHYWTSTVSSGAYSRFLYFTNYGTTDMFDVERVFGMSVRCIQDF